VAVVTAPPVGLGFWLSKPELDALPASGTYWPEVYATATSSWSTTAQPITTDNGGTYMRQVMAAALVFARLKPANGSTHAEADALRAKIATAIASLITQPHSTSIADTRPARFLGGWAICADLINLPAYDAALNSTASSFTTTGTNSVAANAGFRGWLEYSLAFWWNGTISDQIRRGSSRLLTNKGSWSRWSRAACAIYLGNTSEVNTVAQTYRRWLGNSSLAIPAGEVAWQGNTDGDTFQAAQPVTTANRVGVNPVGYTRDGNNLDGVMPATSRAMAVRSYRRIAMAM